MLTDGMQLSAQPVSCHTPAIYTTYRATTSIGPGEIAISRLQSDRPTALTPDSLDIEIHEPKPQTKARRFILLTIGTIISALGASNPIRNQMATWVSFSSQAKFDSSLDLICLCLFAMCTTLLYHSDEPSKYRDLRLISGIVLGVIVGILIGYDLRDSLFRIVPWTILASTRIGYMITRLYHITAYLQRGITTHPSVEETEKG